MYALTIRIENAIGRLFPSLPGIYMLKVNKKLHTSKTYLLPMLVNIRKTPVNKKKTAPNSIFTTKQTTEIYPPAILYKC